MKKTCLGMLLAALIITSACTRATFDPAAEGPKLLQRDAEWADAASAGKDIDKIVSYWSDDAIVMVPGQPLYEGKAAIRHFVEQSLHTPGFKIHWVSEKPIFSPDGMMAFMRGATEMNLPGPNGGAMTVHMRGITIWRRSKGGEWLCVADIGNEPPAPAPAK